MTGTEATPQLLTQTCFGHESCYVQTPVIDYSMLISNDSLKSSQAINDLNQACLNYGFFTVTNHGIPDSLIGSVTSWLSRFFHRTDEEKRRYATNDPTDRIRFMLGGVTKRELLHMRTHPTFHCPTMPDDPMVLEEYSERMREMGIQLLRGISKSLGLEECYMEKKMKLESGYNILGPNFYQSLSRCSDDKNQIGQFPHRDPGLLVLIAQNVGGGLQIKHQGKWLNADFPPSSIGVLVADNIEILTNGKYKSLLHRVALNTQVERLSLPFFFGPSLDAIVKPEPEFVDDHNPPSYRQMTYKEYLESNSRYHVIEAKANLINEALLSS